MYSSSPEERKGEFKLYLLKCGVQKEISKVLTNLYLEKQRPKNALDYVRKFFGNPSGESMNAMRNEINTLKQENKDLKEIIYKLTNENEKLKDEIFELTE